MPNGHHVYLDGPMVGTLQKVVTSIAQQSLEFEPGEKFFFTEVLALRLANCLNGRLPAAA